MVPRPDPATDPPPVDAYLATVVSMYLRGADLLVTPDPEATVPTPRSLTHHDTIHLITAANPYSIEVGDAENEQRNAEAAAQLDRTGIRHAVAVGMDLERTWAEPGFAILDAPDDIVMALADDWCQHGIYRWDADGWCLVLTDGSRPISYPVSIVEVS